ncbi:MAG: hypothetical protein PWP46_700 [Fusobacteriaceae bacterium]|jgi:Na+/H+-dicarboxylate symporter|nr:hypothetical protein [Fusobacteriaceae bacterium]
MKKLGLLSKLIIGIISGIIIGLISKSLNSFIIVRIMATFSSIFGNFLKFIIPCIIIGFVAPGIADLGKKANKMLGITVVIAYVSTIVAGFSAFLIGSNVLPKFIKAKELTKNSNINIESFFTIDMPPIMGIMSALIFAFLIGLGMAHLKSTNLFDVVNDFQQIMKNTVNSVLIPLIPIHIAGIFAKISASGEIFYTMKTFSSVFALILSLQVIYVLVQYTISCTFAKKNMFEAIKNILPAYFTALGTQSSAATIPVSLECSRNNNVDEDIVDFVVPLGATIHLAGDTITLVLATMAVLLMYGTTPTFAMMFPFVLMLGVTMVAAPGIPGGGVYATLGLLEKMFMFGTGQQGLMIAIHFAQDSFGTATNVSGDGAIAILVNEINKKLKQNK